MQLLARHLWRDWRGYRKFCSCIRRESARKISLRYAGNASYGTDHCRYQIYKSCTYLGKNFELWILFFLKTYTTQLLVALSLGAYEDAQQNLGRALEMDSRNLLCLFGTVNLQLCRTQLRDSRVAMNVRFPPDTREWEATSIALIDSLSYDAASRHRYFASPVRTDTGHSNWGMNVQVAHMTCILALSNDIHARVSFREFASGKIYSVFSIHDRSSAKC